mmetsp:Transcript_37409/g.110479  ORF Transcript_37409/g.110479 Transcript_37409/m.110479 type:complete len:240 (+) Transcript_37409:208-927(+)
MWFISCTAAGAPSCSAGWPAPAVAACTSAATLGTPASPSNPGRLLKVQKAAHLPACCSADGHHACTMLAVPNTSSPCIITPAGRTGCAVQPQPAPSRRLQPAHSTFHTAAPALRLHPARTECHTSKRRTSLRARIAQAVRHGGRDLHLPGGAFGHWGRLGALLHQPGHLVSTPAAAGDGRVVGPGSVAMLVRRRRLLAASAKALQQAVLVNHLFQVSLVVCPKHMDLFPRALLKHGADK